MKLTRNQKILAFFLALVALFCILHFAIGWSISTSLLPVLLLVLYGEGRLMLMLDRQKNAIIREQKAQLELAEQEYEALSESRTLIIIVAVILTIALCAMIWKTLKRKA